MDLPEHRLANTRRMALACVLLILCVTTLSAYMRLSNAGLGCTDWPACYGAQLRDAATNSAPPASETAIALARMLHRLAAVIVLVLALTMAAASFMVRPRLWREGRLALGLVAIALGLAVLGRFTPGAKLPIVAIGNVLGGFSMLLICWRLWRGRGATGPGVLDIALVMLLFVQVAAGVMVSASFSGLSCSGFPGCGAAVETSLALLDPTRVPSLDPALPNHPEGAFAHMLHRALALLVAVVATCSAILAWRHGQRRHALALTTLLALQIALGVTMVLAALPFAPALLHNLVAALMLAVASDGRRA